MTNSIINENIKLHLKLCFTKDMQKNHYRNKHPNKIDTSIPNKVTIVQHACLTIIKAKEKDIQLHERYYHKKKKKKTPWGQHQIHGEK